MHADDPLQCSEVLGEHFTVADGMPFDQWLGLEQEVAHVV